MKNINPLIKEFIKLKLIKKKNFLKLSSQTRDKKVNVIKDKKSGVIFLEKYLTKIKYYSVFKEKDRNIDLHSKKIFSVTKIKNKGYIKTLNLEDDRRRSLQFKKYLKNKNILDFGCGWAGFLSFSKKYAKSCNGIEIRKNCLNFIKSKFSFIKVENNLNKFNQKFDIITMFHVLEHIPYQIETIKKLKNKLKSKGKIIIEVPSAQDFLLSFDNLPEFKKFTFWSEHLVLHTEKSLMKILIKSGFRKIQILYFQRYNLNNHLGWFVKRKPGGHDFFKNVSDNIILKNYRDFLIRSKRTDTLIAIATK
tara:strand:+ start:1842 stop:2759 length:918 start_codon:yes stop_codon:yes gene_type:complete